MSYQLDWLEKNNFSQENTKRVKRHGRLVPISWGREYRNHIYQENYDKVVVVNYCFTLLFGTNGHLSDIVIVRKQCSPLMK